MRKIRWDRIVLLATTVVLLAIAASLNTTIYGINLIVGLLLAAAHAGSLLLSYFRPFFGMPASLISVLLIALLLDPVSESARPFTVVGMLTQLLVVVACGLRARWYISALCWLGSIGAAVVGGSHFSMHLNPTETGNVVIFASIGFGVVVASSVVRQWQLIRTQLTVERNVSAAEAARRQLVEDRAGIARELHDVVAHGMSLVTVQATTARYRYPNLEKNVAAEFEEIAEHSRRAMTEMRHILGVLRAEGSDKETLPQPGAGDLRPLIESIRRAGIAVDISTPPVFDPGPVLGLTVYRIVQEALSNVVRHAPNSRAVVRISQDSRHVLVLVENRPAAVVSPESKGGHGLIGMRERAQAVGGTLEYGPSEDGGFRVEASLPLSPGRTPDGKQRKIS